MWIYAKFDKMCTYWCNKKWNVQLYEYSKDELLKVFEVRSEHQVNL